MLLSIYPDHPEPRKIRRAVELLEAGEVIGYPTDSVYGLGCDAYNKRAVERLYQIKRMARTQPLALLCRDISEVARYTVLRDVEFHILKRYLPGPYCFVLRASKEAPRLAQSDRKTLGIRIPKHPVTQALCAELGRPLLSSSAFRDTPEPDPKEIDIAFPGLGLVLDAGPGDIAPTSVIDLSGPEPRVLRTGAGDVSEFTG